MMHSSAKVVCVGKIIRYGTNVGRSIIFDPQMLSLSEDYLFKDRFPTFSNIDPYYPAIKSLIKSQISQLNSSSA